MTELIESQLFPCIDYIKILEKGTNIKISIFERFRKMTFHNRYIIAGANGLITLTIPVMGGREQKSLLTNISIDRSENWQARHWKSIHSAYRKSPYFDYYADAIWKLIHTEIDKLFDYNKFVLENIIAVLGIKCKVDAVVPDDAFTTEIARQHLFLPRNFQEGRTEWKPKYQQVFEDRLGFQPNLSVIDLLFCEGPNALPLLEASNCKGK